MILRQLTLTFGSGQNRRFVIRPSGWLTVKPVFLFLSKLFRPSVVPGKLLMRRVRKRIVPQIRVTVFVSRGLKAWSGRRVFTLNIVLTFRVGRSGRGTVV